MFGRGLDSAAGGCIWSARSCRCAKVPRGTYVRRPSALPIPTISTQERAPIALRSALSPKLSTAGFYALPANGRRAFARSPKASQKCQRSTWNQSWGKIGLLATNTGNFPR